MFKIGEFSKLVQVPVPTLRYYDEVGLLKPIEVDRFTGYRYYSADQLPRLNRILALKGLGFTLEQIAEVLAEGLSPEQMRGMFRLRHAQISQQLAEVQSQLIEVEVRLQQIEQEEAMSTYDVILKQVEPLLVASVRAKLPLHNDVSPLYAEVYGAMSSHAAEAGQTLAIWYDDDYKSDNVDGAAAFILRSRIPENGRMRVDELPAATMATTVHHGSYNTLGKAYEAILKWMEPNSYRIAGPSREIYLYNTMPVNHDDSTYVTEVQVPVERLSDHRN